MSHESQTITSASPAARPLSLNPAALSCFAVAVCAIATSLVGLAIPHFPAGGMALVGMFYLVVGLFDAVLYPALRDESEGQPATAQPATNVRLHPNVTDAHNTVDDRTGDPHEGVKKAHDRRRELAEA